MENASRDQNNVTTLLAASSADGKTPVKVYANPVTHRLLTDATAGVTGPGSSTDNAIVRFNGTTGQTIQNSVITLDDDGNMDGGGQRINIVLGSLSVANGMDFFNSISWANRVLYGNDGVTLALEWSNPMAIKLSSYTTPGILYSTADGTIVTNVVAPIADGTYTVGIGPSTNGTITVSGGIITGIQEAS